MEPVLGINTHVRSRSFSGSPDKDVSTVSDRGGTQAALRPEDTLQALISGMQAQVDGTGDLERDSSIPSSSAVALGVISASKTKSVLELSRINRIEIFRERAEQIRVILERERKRGILTQQTRHRVHNYIAHTMERHAYKNATTMDEYTQIIDVAIETMWADAESINEMVRVAGERMVDFVAKQQRKADLIVTPQTTNPSPPTEAPQSGTVAGTRTSVLQVDGPSVVSMDGTVESVS
ncbi:hypothetical protein MMC19_006872 [Ptychographa xylographoides]|nr:hypothetical protein [Ptychographa xylographoides]